DGVGSAFTAILQLGANVNQLPPLASVTVNSDGEFNVSTDDGVGTLTLHGGVVAISSSTFLDIEPGGSVVADGVGSAINGPGSLRLGSGGATRTFNVADGAGANDLVLSA